MLLYGTAVWHLRGHGSDEVLFIDSTPSGRAGVPTLALVRRGRLDMVIVVGEEVITVIDDGAAPVPDHLDHRRRTEVLVVSPLLVVRIESLVHVVVQPAVDQVGTAEVSSPL